MRAALNGTGEVATLVGRTEAATVLFDSPAATLRDVPPAEAKTAIIGETTVVRSPVGTAKRRITPWVIAIRNSEKAVERRANPTGAPELTPGVTERYPDVKNLPAVPNTPEIPVPEGTQPNRRALRRLGIPTTRNFPDGTQVMTLADGTRIVTFPDGTKRVFGPGQKIVRRRGLR